MERVAIVGGGPSALFTAFLLGQRGGRGLEITLFEATNRLGGKIQTARFDAAPILFEAGVAELYRYHDDPLWLLITRVLGLPVVEMTGDAVVFEGKILTGDADIARHFGGRTARAVRDFRRLAREARPFDTFYGGGWPADNRHPWAKRSMKELLSRVKDRIARRYIEVLVHSDLATEPHITSGLYGIDNYLINEPDYCRLYSIEGGIERLVAALSASLSATVVLGARASGVRKTEQGVYQLEYEQDGQRRSAEFDAIVLALPIYALRQLSFPDRHLRRAVDRHVGRYDDPAHYLRITALFRAPFWRGALRGSYFILDAFGGCCVYDEGTRHAAGDHGVLSWLLGGSDALAMSALSDETLIQRALDSLPPVIARAGLARELLLEGHVHRFVGMVSGRPGGDRLEGSRKRHRPEPEEHAGLFLAGDYLFDATTNGALDSADIAATMSLEHLGVASRALGAEQLDDYCGSGRPYSESFGLAFDARNVLEMFRAVWGASPPFRLLDAGSADGATLAAFGALGIAAWGIENCWYIHAKTPEELRERNVFGDVWSMPFPDGHFDFVYETCLSHVPEERLDAALAELRRVTRRGLLLGSIPFGSMATEAPARMFARYAPLWGVQTVLGPEQWAERLRRRGFRQAGVSPETLLALEAIEARAPRGRPVRPTPELLRHAFWEKAETADPRGPDRSGEP